jgi:hypothetical protein
MSIATATFRFSASVFRAEPIAQAASVSNCLIAVASPAAKSFPDPVRCHDVSV